MGLLVLGQKRKSGLYRCKCGNFFVARLDHVKNGHTRSCGCVGREALAAANKKREKGGERVRRSKGFGRIVKERDGGECAVCGSDKGAEAHHLYNFVNFRPLRFDIRNGITLCHKHHYDFHLWNGGFNKKCTALDFIKWLLEQGWTWEGVADLWAKNELVV